MRTILILLALGLCATPAAWAETKPKFQIGAISKGRTMPGTRKINGVYPPSKPTLEFTVAPTEDIPMKELVAIIYFFDENNRLVYQMGAGPELDRTKLDEEYNKKLERMKRDNPKATGFVIELEGPSTAKAGKKYNYRHIIQDNEPKWRHVVVVAGQRDGELSGRVYPKTDLKTLDFTDKSKVTYWYQP